MQRKCSTQPGVRFCHALPVQSSISLHLFLLLKDFSNKSPILFPQLDDCALQLSHNGTYLDLESSLAEQRDELEGFQQDDTGWGALTHSSHMYARTVFLSFLWEKKKWKSHKQRDSWKPKFTESMKQPGKPDRRALRFPATVCFSHMLWYSDHSSTNLAGCKSVPNN